MFTTGVLTPRGPASRKAPTSSLQRAAETELLRRLAEADTLEMPPAAVVATFKAQPGLR